MMDNRIIAGLCGTALSATGASLSISEVQSIISIAITILGFVISVLIPLGVKLYKKIKEAKSDGKITKEEIVDIAKTGIEIAEKTESLVKEVSEKISEGDKE
jgi:uncharacterized protein YoxC